MKPLFALASASALLVATPVFACSEAEAEKMGKEVATKVASITQKNPQRARELNEQLRQRQEARSEQNRPSDCDAYAQMLKELDQEKGDVQRNTSQ
ncbi:hypothetical protein [Pseudomonas aeruginosa]|uniref:hypothetical protein n=1 Tax=Pseudomonas aeruginosa TaxID=287 RepID=UPI0029C0BB73|nr:hypothetical protein [Pseudomonas aeruginosa]